MVIARSAVLIPVVVPRRASIDSREGRAVVRCVHRGHERQGQIVAALFRQRQANEAAAVLGHEVDRLGRDFFRRHGEVALVLAVFVVHQDDLPPLADFFDSFLNAGKLDRFVGHDASATPGS